MNIPKLNTTDCVYLVNSDKVVNYNIKYEDLIKNNLAYYIKKPIIIKSGNTKNRKTYIFSLNDLITKRYRTLKIKQNCEKDELYTKLLSLENPTSLLFTHVIGNIKYNDLTVIEISNFNKDNIGHILLVYNEHSITAILCDGDTDTEILTAELNTYFTKHKFNKTVYETTKINK